MKKFLLPVLLITLLVAGSCANDPLKSTAKGKVEDQYAKICDVERFKLFPTQNMWTFLKLDTQTGKIWQVQYTVNKDSERLELELNTESFVSDGERVNGRFELYSTQNIYNFILLDRIDGRTWQVQWSFDEENCMVLPISR